jgi:phage shock protein C
MAYDDVYGRGGLYRSRNGMIAGVCSGIAEHFDFSVFWTRAITVGAVICSGVWPGLFAYLIAALAMKKDPYVRH